MRWSFWAPRTGRATDGDRIAGLNAAGGSPLTHLFIFKQMAEVEARTKAVVGTFITSRGWLSTGSIVQHPNGQNSIVTAAHVIVGEGGLLDEHAPLIGCMPQSRFCLSSPAHSYATCSCGIDLARYRIESSHPSAIAVVSVDGGVLDNRPALRPASVDQLPFGLACVAVGYATSPDYREKYPEDPTRDRWMAVVAAELDARSGLRTATAGLVVSNRQADPWWRHSCPTTGGFSGCPILTLDPPSDPRNAGHIVGVHWGPDEGANYTNRATRIAALPAN
jgi:hypothetical protein